MSIKLMSAIFETEFFDLSYNKDGEEHKAKASTCKILMLAIADHANDYGESAYPGYTKLEIKTALSRQGIADTLDALSQNGILSISDKPSRLNTNNYTISLTAFPCLNVTSTKFVENTAESSHLTINSQVALLPSVKSLDSNHQLTINKPNTAKEPPIILSEQSLDWQIAGSDAPVTMPNDKLLRQKDAAALISTGLGVSARMGYELALEFQLARDVTFTESQIKGQRKAAKLLLEQNVLPEHVRGAVEKLTAAGMTVTDLYSIQKTAIDLANKAPEVYTGYPKPHAL